MKTWILPSSLALIIVASIVSIVLAHREAIELPEIAEVPDVHVEKRTRSPASSATWSDSALSPRPINNPSEPSTPPTSAPDAVATAQAFAQLAALSPGSEAIALGRRLEAAITPQNTTAYLDALLQTDHPGVERAAHAALARTADSSTLLALVSRYGSTPAERRGRILQVLENAQNPAATTGLIQTVAQDTSEKRSPILVSAMNGLAGLSTPDSVSYLLQQVATDNETFALMALERVQTPQGREMIRAAASRNKDSERIAPEHLAALSRIAGEELPEVNPSDPAIK